MNFWSKKRENVGIKHFNGSNAFTECSDTMVDVYENIDDYNPSRKRKILIAFDDMIVGIMTNKKLKATIKELFIRCRKLNVSLVFIIKFCFSVPKDVRLNSTHCLIMKLTTTKNYKKLQLMILQILITNILWRFTENAQKTVFFFDNRYYVTSNWFFKI